MDDFVRINNRIVSAKSLLISLEGIPIQGITALDYSDKLEPGLVWDSKRDGTPLGMTSGKYTPGQCSITFLNDIFRIKVLPILTALSAAALAPGAIGMAVWTLAVQQVEPGLIPTTDILSGCRLMEAKDTYQEGNDGLMTECTFQPLEISRNGLTLFDRTRSFL